MYDCMGRGYYANRKTTNVEIISEKGDSENHFLLADRNGILVSFPKSLVRANDIKIVNEQMTLSGSLYDTWFKPKIEAEVKICSDILFQYFDVVVNNSDIILNDQEFKRLHLPFLTSTLLYDSSFKYSLGGILQSWMYEDDLKVLSTSYMLKINASAYTGVNNYTAYSPIKRSLFTGKLHKKEKHWKQYLDEFYSLSSESGLITDLSVMTRLILELGIE